MKVLRWIGRQRSRAIAALILIGLLLPPLGAVLKPFVAEAVIGLLCIAFLRMDVSAFGACLRRPQLVVLASCWTMFAIPALVAICIKITGVDISNPALFQGLMLQAVASPVMAAPAFAAIMGLDATLVLATLIFSTVLTPLSAPLFATLLSLDLPMSPVALGVKLCAILAGSAIVGLLLRRLVGISRVTQYRDEIDGLNIVILFVFVSAVMGDVGVEFLSRPMRMLGLIGIAFAMFALLLAATYAVFLAFGARRAFAIGMMTSQRNMGLMLAGTGGAVPELTWLYFAVAQFPIYLSPLMLQPVAERLCGKKSE